MKDEPTPPKSSPQTKQVWKENVISSSESPSQEVQPSRSPSQGPTDAPKEWARLEVVLSGGLKNMNPHRKVTTVVIHIYFLALHKLFFTLAYLLLYIYIVLIKER